MTNLFHSSHAHRGCLFFATSHGYELQTAIVPRDRKRKKWVNLCVTSRRDLLLPLYKAPIQEVRSKTPLLPTDNTMSQRNKSQTVLGQHETSVCFTYTHAPVVASTTPETDTLDGLFEPF